jgi:hypothetical protein
MRLYVIVGQVARHCGNLSVFPNSSSCFTGTTGDAANFAAYLTSNPSIWLGDTYLLQRRLLRTMGATRRSAADLYRLMRRADHSRCAADGNSGKQSIGPAGLNASSNSAMIAPWGCVQTPPALGFFWRTSDLRNQFQPERGCWMPEPEAPLTSICFLTPNMNQPILNL